MRDGRQPCNPHRPGWRSHHGHGRGIDHQEIDNALMMAQGQLVYHPVVMFRRQVVLDLGGYRPEYYSAEDLDLFLRLAEVGRIVNLAEPLLKVPRTSPEDRLSPGRAAGGGGPAEL